MNFSKKMDSPHDFLKIIPRNVQENLQFRLDLQEIAVKDKGFQKTLLEMCRIVPEIAFDALFWTFDPRKEPGLRNHPFILRPRQRLAVQTLKKCIDTGHDAGINKSRDEGATEIVSKLFALYWLLEPESMFLVGSRKEEYVDRGTDIKEGRVSGDHKCIFHKILYAIATTPLWMRPNFRKTYMHFENLENSAVIDGESTNENFGAGDRRTAILLDEFGRVDYNIAKDIRDTINDTTNCAIYSSTHFYGSGHPFNKAIKNKAVEVVTLPWYENPEKRQGIYTSPDLNQIQIIDIDYYRNICPEVFKDIEVGQTIDYGDLEKELLTQSPEIQEKVKDIKFIADGCENIPGDYRSPWHDREEERRTARDLAQNVWMNPSGASDMYFDTVVNNQILIKYGRQPDHTGELKFTLDQNGLIKAVQYQKNRGKNRLKWWGNLKDGRPNQTHNYIIGCDISLGTGASNSVAEIYDVNLSEQVGEWACPDTTPENFADLVVALAKWVGGTTKCYLIWENNGGHGINFGRRITRHHKYLPVYTSASEDTKRRVKRDKFGWSNNRDRKDDLLAGLKIALKESLKFRREHKFVIIHSPDLVNELEDYIFYESGEIGASEVADQTSGARLRHGDRVIAMGLCLLGTKEQRKAMHQEKYRIKPGSMAWRLREYRKEKKRNRQDSPWLY